MDGVLFDTEVLYERFWCEAARQSGFLMTPEHVAAIRSTDSKVAAQITKNIFGEAFDYYAIRELRKKLMQEYINENGITRKKGVLEILEFLKNEKHLKIALATTSNQKRTQRYLSMGKISSYFDALVCGDMVTRGKPDPMIYETAASSIGLLPKECIACEDSHNGVRSAYQAGCQVCMIVDRDEPDNEMREKTVGIFESAEEIAKLFER